MTCHNCQITAIKLGKDRYGSQRYRCNKCRKTFGELKDRPLGKMRIKFEKALLCLQLLLEGNSIRSTQRITELVPGKKVVWHVLEARINFVQDQTEWTGTDIVFDIARKGRMPLQFGLGHHVCPGMNIARSEIGITLETMFDSLPGLRLDPDAPPPAIRGVHARGPAELHVIWD